MNEPTDFERLANDAMRDESNEEPAIPRPAIYRALRRVDEHVWYLDEVELCRVRVDLTTAISKHRLTPRQTRSLLSALLTEYMMKHETPETLQLTDLLHQIDTEV